MSLDSQRRIILMADDDVEDRVRSVLAGQRATQLRLEHDDRSRLQLAPIENTGHEPVLTQAPVGSGTSLRAFLNLELHSLGSHGGEV